MAYLEYPLTARFSSWAHPITINDGGVYRRSTTDEVVAQCIAQGGWNWINWGHAWYSDRTFALDARVERVGSPLGDGKSYRSIHAGNLNHDPLTSPAWWEPVDDGLGADDGAWLTIPGLSRLGRVDAAGLVSYHFFPAYPSWPLSGVYWHYAFSGGQWAMASGGAGSPCVRVSPTSQTYYSASFGGGNDEGGDWIEVTLFRCVAGVTQQIGYSREYLTEGGGGNPTIYAYGNRVGACYGTGVATTANVPSYPAPDTRTKLKIMLEVTDSSIPEATGPYVGFIAGPGPGSTHEFYGGSFEAPPIVALPGTLPAPAAPVSAGSKADWLVSSPTARSYTFEVDATPDADAVVELLVGGSVVASATVLASGGLDGALDYPVG